MAFFPLFYVGLEPSTRLGTLNEGLYVMTYQTNTTDVGILVGLSIVGDRIGHLHIIPEYNRARSQEFPERQYLGNIQLSGPAKLLQWLSTRRHTVNLVNTIPNSPDEVAAARRWFMDVAQELKNLKL